MLSNFFIHEVENTAEQSAVFFFLQKRKETAAAVQMDSGRCCHFLIVMLRPWEPWEGR